MEIPIGAIAPWIHVGSLSLNVGVLVAGLWAIARRGGWKAVRDRLFYGQSISDQQIHRMPYYTHRRSQLDLLPIQPSDIVFLGDSITDEGEWADWFPDWPIRNRGISADTTTGVLRRLDSILEGTPAKLFLMIGHNDLAVQGKPPERVLQHYRQILQQIRERTPHTQVYVQSVLPVALRPQAVELNLKIRQVNQSLERLAAQFGYPYVDLHAVFLDGNQLNLAYTTDGIHLNGDGYALWVRQIGAEVRTSASPNEVLGT